MQGVILCCGVLRILCLFRSMDKTTTWAAHWSTWSLLPFYRWLHVWISPFSLELYWKGMQNLRCKPIWCLPFISCLILFWTKYDVGRSKVYSLWSEGFMLFLDMRVTWNKSVLSMECLENMSMYSSHSLFDLSFFLGLYGSIFQFEFSMAIDFCRWCDYIWTCLGILEFGIFHYNFSSS